MTISKVKICNMALANIGARNTIESLIEQSAEAKICNLWYDHSRLLALEGYNWNFAKKRQALALSSEASPTGVWTYRYVYPVDCVKARELEQGNVNTLLFNTDTFFNIVSPNAVPFEVEMASNGETKTILTDLEEAVLVYTFDQQNVNVFSTQFVYTLSYALAYNIAFSLTGKRSVQQDMFNAYNYLLRQASMNDANERVDRPTRDAQAIQARN